MNKIILSFLLLLVLTGCKKTEEKIQEVRAMSFITNGQWKVSNLTKNGTDYTNDFNFYVFLFKTDGKVDAYKNGTKEITGVWEGNITTGIIKSNFPVQAIQPLPLLNGSWQIKDGGSSFVVATKTENGETSTLRLEKL